MRGHVYDSTGFAPVQSVSVLSTNGSGTITQSDGAYEIMVGEKDSVWFSYLDKPTRKYALLDMIDPLRFNIALQSTIPVLSEVKIRQRDYKLDSLQNRIDYAKAFDFERPNIGSMTSIGANGAGIDLDELIRVFQFRRNRSMEKFRDRLIVQEQDKFINYRFSKALVLRLTGLKGSNRDLFMRLYRPSYDFTLSTSDYEFQDYIRKAFENYKMAHPEWMIDDGSDASDSTSISN